jgi:hypothetical protein
MRTDAFGATPAAPATPKTDAKPTPVPAPADKPAAAAVEHKPPQTEADTDKANAQRSADAAAFGDTPAPAASGKPVDPNVKKAADAAAAASTAKAATASGQDGSNQPEEESERRKELRETAGKLGAAEGQGTNSRAELAIAVCIAVTDGVINPSSKSPDVADMWDAFQAARRAAKRDITGEDDIGGEKAATKSDEIQVSKLRQFAKLGAKKEFVGHKVLTRARDFIAKEAAAKSTYIKGSTFDNLLTVARAMNSAKCTKGLTNPEIKNLLMPDEPEEVPNEVQWLKKLEGITKTITSLLDGTEERAPFESQKLKGAYELVNSEKIRVEKIVADKYPKDTPPAPAKASDQAAA